MTSNKSLWEILVPRFSNQGKEYPVEYHKKWDETVRGIAGGVTILKPAKGHWINPNGESLVEEVIPVRILCTEPQIDKIIDHTLEYYGQEAVLAYEISSRVKMVYQPKG